MGKERQDLNKQQIEYLALDVDGITPRAKSILKSLVMRINPQTLECWPGLDRLARDCGYKDRKAVSKGIAELVSKGLIRAQRKPVHKGDRKCPTHYTLLFVYGDPVVPPPTALPKEPRRPPMTEQVVRYKDLCRLHWILDANGQPLIDEPQERDPEMILNGGESWVSLADYLDENQIKEILNRGK